MTYGHTGTRGPMYKYAPPPNASYKLVQGAHAPSPGNSERNQREFNVFIPPYKERSRNARGPPPPLEILEQMTIEGGRNAGTSYIPTRCSLCNWNSR